MALFAEEEDYAAGGESPLASLQELIDANVAASPTGSELLAFDELLAPALMPALSDFCTAAPELRSSDGVLRFFLRAFPAIVAGAPALFAPPGLPPLKCALAAALCSAYTRAGRLALAPRVAMQARVRALLLALRRAAAAGGPPCASVMAVVEHLLRQQMLGPSEQDLDVHSPETSHAVGRLGDGSGRALRGRVRRRRRGSAGNGGNV
jgi:hypothetical protein